MEIHISRGGQNFGKFTKEEFEEGIKSGRLMESDLAWMSGRKEWSRAGALAADLGIAIDEGRRSGVEWETDRTSGAFARTIKSVLFSPGAAFRGLGEMAGFGRAYLFFVLCFGLGTMAAMAYGVAANIVIFGIVGEDLGGAAPGAGATILANLAVFPLYLCLGAGTPFIGAGMNHLGLILLGGAKKPFAATMRTYCYANGSAMALLLIPVCGGVVGWGWGVVCNVVGLSEVQGIGRGKAVLVIFLPLVIYCSLVAGTVAILMGLGLAARG